MESLKIFIQSLFNKLGYQIRRMEPQVSLTDAFGEQKRLLKNCDVKVIFDVGAAYGLTSEHYHQLFPDATIYSFEPFPKSFKILEDFSKNKPYIIPLNYAICDKIGDANFNITQLDDASSLLSPNQTESSFDRHHVLKNTITVKTTTIEEICKIYNITEINILKLDTQGAEVIALKGAKALLENKNISLIYSECQFIHLYKDAAQFFEINNLLDSFDYKLFNIYNLIHNEKGQLSWGDSIFIPA